ncbi:MAG: 2-C-methyl-D-erythritol 2,4-cyclodiphosphate synthase [Gammaproteobacteria bacterium]|nr:2-C-methyl-D-erythritol 2,4-cyclodiphosphate synthase [Gammaproteobacteria bacterium]
MTIRLGNGFDVHKFSDSTPLILGGVTIPYHRGLAAHSDGDVVIHAICDAILGALALGDIGKHFPDTDARYKGIDSRQLLRHVTSLMQQHQYRIGNVDATVIAQAPKLAPHITPMRTCLAADMHTTIDTVSIKATTTEQLGFTGRGEGIAVFATALLFLTTA